jgi:tetratricopeptide (TPR) repeat protein
MGSMADQQNIQPTPPAGAGGPEPKPGPEDAAATADKVEGAESSATDKPADAKGLTPGQRLAAKRNKKAQQKQDFKSELKRKDEQQRAEEEEEAERVMGVYRAPAAPDAVQEVARDFSSYVHDHRNLIIGGLLLLLVVGLGVVFGKNYVATGSAEQARLLATAIEIANAQVDAANTEGKDSDGKPVFKSEADRASKAAEAFAAAVKNAPDSSGAHWAKLGQGSVLTLSGKADEAVTLFASTFAGTDGESAMNALALEGHVIALESAGKVDEALKQLERLKGYDDGAYKDVAEYHLARIKLARGDREAAKTLLKGVYDRLGSPAEGAPKSRFLKGEVEVRLAELDSSLVPAGGGAQEFSPEEIQRLIQQLQQQKGGAPAGAGE